MTRIGWNGCREMVVHSWFQLKGMVRLIASGDGNKLLGHMPQYIADQTLTGPRKYGSTSWLSTQLLHPICVCSLKRVAL